MLCPSTPIDKIMKWMHQSVSRHYTGVICCSFTFCLIYTQLLPLVCWNELQNNVIFFLKPLLNCFCHQAVLALSQTSLRGQLWSTRTKISWPESTPRTERGEITLLRKVEIPHAFFMPLQKRWALLIIIHFGL